MIKIALDGLAPNINECVVQSWFFEEGDPVTKGDELAELSSTEGAFVVRATASGLLAEVYFDEGETIAKGEVVCAIDDEDDEDEDDKEDKQA